MRKINQKCQRISAAINACNSLHTFDQQNSLFFYIIQNNIKQMQNYLSEGKANYILAASFVSLPFK